MAYLLLMLSATLLMLSGTVTALAAGLPAHGSFISSRADCHGVSLVAVSAHMDDDVLFINPGISDVLDQGGCVTVIFMNGGSSGAGFDYVLRREAAATKTYARMIGADTKWTESLIVSGDVRVKRVTAAAKPEVTLVYIRVPGGNVRGGDVPLANIFDQGQAIKSWPYTDLSSGRTNTFSKASLVALMSNLIEGFGATKVYALNPDTVPFIEHPDHIYSARFTRAALRGVSRNIPVAYHETYASSAGVPNVVPTATQSKRDFVGTYFNFEGGGAEGEGVFSEATWNGNWIARRNFTMAHAHDNTPEVKVPMAVLVNLETQQCLTAQGMNNAPSMDGCDKANKAQLWSFVPSSANAGTAGSALLKNAAGNCIAYQNAALSEQACASKDAKQQWTPWDFGKIFAPGGQDRCLDAGASSLIEACGPYKGSMLWARNVENVDSDKRIEVALAGDVAGDGTAKLVQIHRRTDGPGINVWVSSLTAQHIQSTKWYDGVLAFDPSAFQASCGQDRICYDQSRYLLADFDGDGRADLMVITPRQGGTAFWLLRSNGSSFATPVLWAQTSASYHYDLAQQYLAGNFLGNKKADVLIAHTRGDSGLNFWVMGNTGSGLASPVRWIEAKNISKSAQLYAATLRDSKFTDVLAVDATGEGLRFSSFQNTGAGFIVSQPRSYGIFDPARAKVVLANAASRLSDIWVLHARADGTAINFWKMANSGNGSFKDPALVHTENTLAWADMRAYPTPSGRQILFPYRVNDPVNEYYWRVGPMGVKAINLSATGIPEGVVDFGQSSSFEWANLQWRDRLN